MDGKSDSDDVDAEPSNEHTYSLEVDEISTIAPSDRESITLSTTVNVSDMDERDTEIIARLADQMERNFEEVVAKNRDYDWSFLRTGHKLSQSPGTPFDNPVRSQVYGLLTRAGDKRERLVENVYGDGDAAVSDPPHVTALEAANYWYFLAFVLDNPELASSFSGSL